MLTWAKCRMILACWEAKLRAKRAKVRYNQTNAILTANSMPATSLESLKGRSSIWHCGLITKFRTLTSFFASLIFRIYRYFLEFPGCLTPDLAAGRADSSDKPWGQPSQGMSWHCPPCSEANLDLATLLRDDLRVGLICGLGWIRMLRHRIRWIGIDISAIQKRLCSSVLRCAPCEQALVGKYRCGNIR